MMAAGVGGRTLLVDYVLPSIPRVLPNDAAVHCEEDCSEHHAVYAGHAQQPTAVADAGSDGD